MPLYHFATADLPGYTIAPEISDINAAASLKANAKFTGKDLSAGGFVDKEIMDRSYLAGIGFLQLPTGKEDMSLPEANISPVQKIALLRVGRRTLWFEKQKASSFFFFLPANTIEQCVAYA
jgi:L-aminoadipate-semialdehyde dehydrogenase